MSVSTARPATARTGLTARVRTWPVWSTPPRVLGAVLIVEATAVLLVGLAAIVTGLPRLPDLATAVLLLALGLLHTEAAVRVERARRRVDAALHVDLSSVWMFAAALIVPPALAAAVVAVLQLHVWWRAWHPRAPLYRQVFTIATLVLACLAVAAVAATAGLPELLRTGNPAAVAVLVLAVLAFATVNTALIAGAILLSAAQPRVADALGDVDDNVLELATLFLGALTALTVLADPWLTPLVLPGVLMLHRVTLVRHLRHAADTDPKTGLLNAAAWYVSAERRLAANAGSTVLVIDLDHFKRVNDTHGHLVGDHVLHAVATRLREVLRPADVLGRFGGEEFVVLQPGSHQPDAAERIRRGIDSLRVTVDTADGPLTLDTLTVSVGSAVYPEHGTDLTALLQVADTALYAAKKAGRNAVRVGLV